MASPNKIKLTEQQSNDHNHTTPPTPRITLNPNVDTAREIKTRAENVVGVLTPATHATGTEAYHSGQVQGSPDQVAASTKAMAIPSCGINPQQHYPKGALTVAPLQWIITTPENYEADDGHNEGQSDSDSDYYSSDAGDGEQFDSGSRDGGDEQQSGSDSGDYDGHQDDEDEHSDSDSGATGGEGDSDSDSGDADDEKQSGSDSGDSDDEDEEQSDSGSGDDGEEEENEEAAEEGEEDMDVDDENTATPTGVNTDDGGNNSLSTPGSIEMTHRDAERNDPGMPDLTSDSSEEDNDGPNIRGPVTATSPGLENDDGESSDGVEIADGASVLMTMQRRTGVTMGEPRPARTPASNASDDGNANNDQTQRATPMSPEEAGEENDVAMSSDVASEEDAPASSQEDEDMKSDSEEDAPASGQEDEDMKSSSEDHEGSGTLSLRGGAGEPDMEAYHDEEEIELTGSGSHLLPAEVPETPPRTRNSARESRESGVTPNQDMEEAASEPDIEASHYEEEIEPTVPERRVLPAEIPETPARTTNSARETQEPAVTPNQDTEEAASESDIKEEGEVHGQAVSPDQDLEGTANQPDAMIDDGQEDANLDSPENPETPPRGRHGEGPDDPDYDEGGAVSSPEIRMVLLPGYQRPEGNGQNTQEPAAPSEQDFDDNTSEPDDWDADCVEADHFQFREEIPENPPRSAQRLGDDPADYDLDEGEEVPSTEDRVALLTGYRRAEANDEDDPADGDQGGESSTERKQSKGKSKEISPNEPSGSDDPLGSPDRQQSKEKPSDFSPNEPSGSDDPTGKEDRTDEKTIHLRVQYLVARSKRSKASMCLWIPADIPYPVLTQTILNALQQHDGTPNPHPAHPDAVIARLLLFIAGRRPIELTSDNLRESLALMPQRSIYDYVKVQFVPGTNGEMRPRKGTGKVNGRCGKVGGL